MGQRWSDIVDARCPCSCGRPHDLFEMPCADESLALARSFLSAGNYAEAEQAFRKALSQCELELGSEHQMTIQCLVDLGDSLCQQGKYSSAEPYFQRAVELEEKVSDNPPLRSLESLHMCLVHMGKHEDAETVQKKLNKPRRKRTSLKGILQKGTRSMLGLAEEIPKLVMITDAGQDGDDEMALLLASELIRAKEMELLAVIANLRPTSRRAALARGTLDMLGLERVPVGIGTDGGSQKHKDTFSEYISVGKTGVDYFSSRMESAEQVEKAVGTPDEARLSQECSIFDGQKLLKETLEAADDGSVTLLLVSSLKDASLFLENNISLFQRKILQVIIMGGCQPAEAGKDLEPSDAHNNEFDMAGSAFVYKRCQELQVPMIILSRFTAYACPVQKKVYDLMVRCPVPNPVACRLQRAQRSSIEGLWKNVCEGGILPDRCDKQWFCNTFCCGEGIHRSKDDSMWDLIKNFNMYDPLALLAAIPSRLDQFFDPEEHFSASGSRNLLLGGSKEQSGIRSQEDLHDFLLTTWIRAAGRPVGGVSYTDSEQRPVELDAEHLTAALQPMREHSQEEMGELTKNVLRVLDQEWPKYKNSSKIKTGVRERDQLMREIGPSMLVMDPDTILRLGRIPHSAEKKGISLGKAAELAESEGRRFFIEMFSHRWYSKYAPDDCYNNKARVLIEWSNYRRSMGLRTFYWIDYVCIDQSDIAPGVAMLPLYVSCCNNILCYDTPPYEPRAWCRVERLMFVSFVAPNIEYVSPDFLFDSSRETLTNETNETNETNQPVGGELKPSVETKETVPDPSAADSLLSYPSDAPLISNLKDLCTQHWGKCWQDGLMDKVEEGARLKEIRKLRYGATQVRVRKFYPRHWEL